MLCRGQKTLIVVTPKWCFLSRASYAHFVLLSDL